MNQKEIFCERVRAELDCTEPGLMLNAIEYSLEIYGQLKAITSPHGAALTAALLLIMAIRNSSMMDDEPTQENAEKATAASKVVLDYLNERSANGARMIHSGEAEAMLNRMGIPEELVKALVEKGRGDA